MTQRDSLAAMLLAASDAFKEAGDAESVRRLELMAKEGPRERGECAICTASDQSPDANERTSQLASVVELLKNGSIDDVFIEDRYEYAETGHRQRFRIAGSLSGQHCKDIGRHQMAAIESDGRVVGVTL